MIITKPKILEIIFYYPHLVGFGDLGIEEHIERCGRTSYKSERKITSDSAGEFIKMLKERGHLSVLEHGFATVRYEADRGFTHEEVRHRLASFTQESTRYCNYQKGRFGGQITVIEQPGLTPGQREIWRLAMQNAEHAYMELIENGVPAEIARSVLPIGVKAEIVVTANFREWLHVFSLRTTVTAHPIMRALMRETRDRFAVMVPSIFGEEEMES